MTINVVKYTFAKDKYILVVSMAAVGCDNLVIRFRDSDGQYLPLSFPVQPTDVFDFTYKSCWAVSIKGANGLFSSHTVSFSRHVANAMYPKKAFVWSKIAPFSHLTTTSQQLYTFRAPLDTDLPQWSDTAAGATVYTDHGGAHTGWVGASRRPTAHGLR